ncbi:MAG: diguanylate cyclase [Ruthenibacterium sp.]
MNALSFLSIVICTSFFIGAMHIVTAQRKEILNVSACAVLLTLGWWSLCNAFFFAADTPEQAWPWHRLSAFGWCGFVAATAYYFFALTNNRRIMAWWKQLLFFAPPVILIARSLFGATTPLAQGIILSKNGFGWTYQNSVTSVWLWAYLAYVALYFGMVFYLLWKWARNVQHKMKKEMAVGFILLDALTILFGVVTDVILPLTVPVWPALASIGTAIFGLGYFGIIYRYDVFNINLVISSDDILQTSNNAIFVMDENKEILKNNPAAANLLGYQKNELIGVDFMKLVAANVNLDPPPTTAELINREVQLRCKDGNVKDVLLSASVAHDKKNSFLCMIVSCQDVSKQKNIQKELEQAQEKYKNLADDYQKLAFYDLLTDLPNRRHLFSTLCNFEKHYHEDGKDFAVLFLDLDNFKQINDVYGHQVGDALLKAAAEKLKLCVEKDEFAARLGGDEFMIVLPGTEIDYIENKMKRIFDEFRHNVFFEGHEYALRVSVGYSVFSEAEDATLLLQKADEAMYRSKKGKKYEFVDATIK